MAAELTVSFPVTGATLDELNDLADAGAKDLANGRGYTVLEVGPVHGAYEGDISKGEPDRPSRFTGQVTARIDAPPDTFRDAREDRAVGW